MLHVNASHVPSMTDAELRRYRSAAAKYAKHEEGDARHGRELVQAIDKELRKRGLGVKKKKAKKKAPKKAARRERHNPWTKVSDADLSRIAEGVGAVQAAYAREEIARRAKAKRKRKSGSTGEFAKLERKLSRRPDVRDPRRLAAWIERSHGLIP